MRPTAPNPPEQVIRLIRQTADRHQVPQHVALAFAWVESRLNPDAEGDLLWHTRKDGQLYARHVFSNPKFQFNPWKDEPARWHSYGLFQLLACYHVSAHEDPRSLLVPATNADRGCREIARLLRITRGDVAAARLAYTGAGFQGTQVTAVVKAQTLLNLENALKRFSNTEEQSR